MTFMDTPLKDAKIIIPHKKEDERGFFARLYCENKLQEHGIFFRVVQVNISWNQDRHTLRGMHFNETPHEEAKIVSCIRGGIFDVIIDIRPDSTTYSKWTGVELTPENRQMMYVPKGFAHGFITLEDHTEVHYLMSEFYKPAAAKGFRWDDPFFKIDWPAVPSVISLKDKSWPFYKTGSIL